MPENAVYASEVMSVVLAYQDEIGSRVFLDHVESERDIYIYIYLPQIRNISAGAKRRKIVYTKSVQR